MCERKKKENAKFLLKYSKGKMIELILINSINMSENHIITILKTWKDKEVILILKQYSKLMSHPPGRYLPPLAFVSLHLANLQWWLVSVVASNYLMSRTDSYKLLLPNVYHSYV